MAASSDNRRRKVQLFLTGIKEYTLEQVFDDLETKLPRMYQVKRGYDGNIIDKRLQKGQLLRIECRSSKDRLAARAITNVGKIRFFSFYEYTSVINSKSDKQGETIFAMVENQTLPVTFSLKRSQGGVSEATKLQFLNYFDEHHLVGNIISSGCFDTDVLYLPTFLSGIRLVEVIGLKDETSASWATFLKKYDRTAASLEYDTQFTRISIALHKHVQNGLVGSETEVKRYIDLRELHDMCMTEDMYEQMAKAVKESKNEMDEDCTEDSIYEEVAGLCYSHEDSDVENDDTDERAKEDNADKTDGDVSQAGGFETTKKKQDEELKARDIDRPKSEAIQSAAGPEEDSIKPPLPPRRNRKDNPPLIKDKPKNSGSTKYMNSNFASVSPVRRYVPDDDIYEKVGDLEDLPSPPDLRDSVPKMALALRRSIVDQTVPNAKPSNILVKRSLSTVAITTNLAETSTFKAPCHNAANDTANARASVPSRSCARKKQYTEPILGKINDKQEVVKGANDGAKQKSVQPQSVPVQTHKNRKQPIDLPEVKSKNDVQKLTIDQLCGYLHILKLDKFIDVCKKEMIDGIILESMSRQDLMDEFNLSLVEAARLEQFTKQGHVPR